MTFLTSRTLIDNGGVSFVQGKDFSEALEHENERMTFDFIIGSFETHLGNLKPREHYADKLSNMPQVSSVSECNQMNLTVLHMDEHDLLTKNLDYLYKAREQNLSKLL